MAMGTDSGTGTTAKKLKDILETQRMVKALISTYKFALNNHEKIIAGYDAELAVITAQKESAIQDYQNAPEQLPALDAQLKELQSRYTTIKDTTSGKLQRIKRFKALRDRLEMLENELKAEGINVDQQPENSTENL